MNLKGKSVLLRAVEPSDADLIFEWENDGSMWFLSNTLTPFSRFEIEQYVLNSQLDIFSAKQLRLMIQSIQDSKTIGSIDVFDFDPLNGRAGIGILITEDSRKKGYASEALELLIEYAFGTLHLHQLYCNITTDNESSLALFRKHHFEIIGNKCQWLRDNGEWKDEYLLQLINK